MKKLLSILLAFTMIISLGACSLLPSDTKQKVTTSTTNAVKGNAVADDDPVYDEIDTMLPCIYKFIEYNHILGNTIDYDNVNAEDFWNIVALVVSSYPKISDIASIDVAGVYHIKWNDMDDIAKTFLYRTAYLHDFPNYKLSYSASADPGSGIIDLVPLNVDNYDVSLEKIDRDTDDPNVDYIVYVKLTGRESDDMCHHYAVYVSEWDKYVKNVYDEVDDRKDQHYMPYMFIGYRYCGSNEKQNESEN